MSIIALIISLVYIILLLTFGALVTDVNIDDGSTELEAKCNNFCQDIDNIKGYMLEPMSTDGLFMCNCLDNLSNVFTQKVYP